MDCCSRGAKMKKETAQNACGGCGQVGRDIARQTVAHHVKSEKLSAVGDAEYKFCPSENCPTVYYSTAGREFTVEDVRELITVKATGDARPVCYCFGFTEGFIRQEIEQTGKSRVPAQVAQFIKDKLCVCEIRNPSGACCLGEINRTVKNLSHR
jgi:Zinc binding domain